VLKPSKNLAEMAANFSAIYSSGGKFQRGLDFRRHTSAWFTVQAANFSAIYSSGGKLQRDLFFGRQTSA
jgi:hypothetical protein